MATVKELRKILSKYPDHMEICISEMCGEDTDVEDFCGLEIFELAGKILETHRSPEDDDCIIGLDEASTLLQQYQDDLESSRDELERLHESLNSIKDDEELTEIGKKNKSANVESRISKVNSDISCLENNIKNMHTTVTMECNKVLILY